MLSSSSLLVLLLACTTGDPDDKTGVAPTDGTTDTTDVTDTPTDTGTDTDTGDPTTTDRPTTTTTPDPCDDPLLASVPQVGVLARQDLRVEATGGSGTYRFSLATNASGATINEISGNYLAGATSGVTDVVQVDDDSCGTSTTIDIQVFLPLEVVPQVATLAPNTSFDIDVSEGSGSFRCEDGLIQTGGGLAAGTCSYSAGSNLGVDQLFVIDDLTGEQVELTYTISDVLEFSGWADVWLLPMDHPHLPRLVGGSGAVDISPPSGLDWDGEHLTGTAEGTYDLTLTDRFTGQTADVTVVVSAPRTPTDPGQDGERFDWWDSDHGDLNGDGYDDVVVATPDGGVAGYQGGGIYVFLGSPTGLETTPVQMFGEGEAYGYGGRSVALGDIDSDGILDLAWGAPGRNEPGANDLGLVRLHKGLGDGTFEADPTWERWGEYGGDQLGYQVAMCDVSGDGADDLVAVGLRGEDRDLDPITYDVGDVRIYTGNPGGPSLDPVWRAHGVYPDGTGGWTTRNTGWGFRMATGDIDGDGACDLALSHYYEGPFDNLDYGMVWSYLAADLTGPAPALPHRVYSSSTQSQFGRTISLGDVDDDGLDDLLVGARGDDTLLIEGGAVYLFLAADDDGRPAADLVLDLDASWQVDPTNNYDYLGWGSTLADLDGDGIDDVVVGASSDELEGGLSNTGVVAWFSSSAVLTSVSATIDEATEAWAPDLQSQQFGIDVGAAGDVDGDGLADLIGPAPRGQVMGPETQRFYPLSQGVAVPYGIELPNNVRATLMGERRSAIFFDDDGDGSLDLVAGAWSEPIEGFSSGGVHRFAQSGGTWALASDQPLASYPGHSASDRRGWSVSSAGDFNGDGREDLVVVAWNDTEPGTFDTNYVNPYDCPSGANVGAAGSAWIHLGTATGVRADPSFVIYGYGASDRIDRAAGGMNIDNDGYDDVVLGSVGTSTTGGFAVVRGRPGDPAGVTVVCDAEWSLGVTANSRLGNDVAAAGDLDGDGCDDFVVGADADDLGRGNQGSLRVMWGDGAGCSGPAVTTLIIDQNNARLGDSVAAGLDADGDGVPDLVGGAYAYDDGDTDQGAAFWVDGGWVVGLARDAAPGWVLPDDGSTTTHIVSNDGRILGEAARDENGRGVALVVDPNNPSRALVATGSRYGNSLQGGATLWAIDGGVVAERPYALVAGESLTPGGQLGDQLAGHPDAPVLLVGAPFGDADWIDQGVVYPFVLP